MKAIVDHDKCIGCGICGGISPRVFTINCDNKSQVVQCPINEDDCDATKDAESSCPVDAIRIIYAD